MVEQMSTAVAIVGATKVSAALGTLLRGAAGGDLRLALQTDRATDERLTTSDSFCEWVLASCAIDPVWFSAHAALRAIRAVAG
jgi:hypothetical protein